jgi:hypothetical protein
VRRATTARSGPLSSRSAGKKAAAVARRHLEATRTRLMALTDEIERR